MSRGRSTWRTWAIVACTGLGLIGAAPVTLAMATHQRQMASVGDVLLTDLDEGRTRVSVVFLVERGHETWLGRSQGDAWWRPGEDPVLERAQAEHLRAEVMPDDGRRPAYTVLYRANDPGGTAFIMIREGLASWGHKIGILLVAVSLMLSLPLPLWETARKRA